MADATRDDFDADLGRLWPRAQAGDELAYREALRRIAARLRAFFRRRLQSLPDEVEDLVQETLLALHLQRGTYNIAVPVTAWVYAIARHKLVDLWRRRGRREALHEGVDDLDALPGAFEDEATLARRDLAVILAQLPPAQQQAIVMTRIEGLSMIEAAQRAGVSVTALKVRVHRGLKRLELWARTQA